MNHLMFPSAVVVALGLAGVASSQTITKSPVELGIVDWEREYSAGLERVREDHKPMLLLFQEVPG